MAIAVVCFYSILHEHKHSEFFRVFGLTKIPLYIFCPLLLYIFFVKKELIEGPEDHVGERQRGGQ